MTETDLDIAIIGGGIAGLTLALGLVHHTNAKVRIYEQARSYREIGAGIGFTPNAERAMHLVDTRIHAGFKKIAVRNVSDWFQYMDGFNEKGDDARYSKPELLFKVYLGERGMEGCNRADFLEELVKISPPEFVEFQKRLETISGGDGNEKLVLNFEDGTSVEADAVIGCDGIRSRVRQVVLGPENPASYPGYTHKYAVRGLVSMDKAVAAIGEDKTLTRFMYLGPGAHLLTFPVAMGKLMNVAAFISDPEEWTDQAMTGKADRAKVFAAFEGFGPTVRAILDLLPPELGRWGVFDTYDSPAPTYVNGRIALAGDAAHAASPHSGAGAGFGIEDAAVLSSLLATISSQKTSIPKADALRTAFEVYDSVRRPRAEWLVESSRILGELYDWRDPEAGRDADKCYEKAYQRSHAVWDYDVNEMVLTAQRELSQRLGQSTLTTENIVHEMK